MDVFDRLQSGLFFHPNLLDSTPTIPQPHISSNKAVPTNIYAALSGIPAAHFPSINTPPAPEVPLPLLSVSVDVDVHGRLCTTKVTQQFSNAFPSTSQNVKYVFPIYDGSVVTSFRCWIGNDKLLEGAVKAKEAARADFKHAVSQRKVAVLVEELTPEVFETSVGNIPAQTTVKVEITYANLLKVDNSTGGLVLTIPTSIAPRYGTLPPGYSGNQSLLTEGLRINVQVSMPAAIRKMESRSHPISIEMGAVSHKSFKNFAAGASSDTVDYSKGQATLSDRNAVLHQDFVLHILCSSREPSQSRAVAATQPGQGPFSTIAVTINPGDLFRQRVNVGDFVGEIIFMADRSGSMGPKIPSLINVMNIFLRSLPEACSFNIASFGSDVTWLWPSSKTYSQENLDVASKHVDSFQANYGGTDIYHALQSVLDHFNRQNDVPTSVILLTDGEVWDVDHVIQLVRRTVTVGDSNIRFFSLGIGDRVSHRLVEGIGQQGGGYAEIVPESSMGSWQERVIQMLKAALTPSRLQCNVDLGKDLTVKTSEREIAGYRVQYPECIQAPHHIPVLNTFSHFSLYYMLESGLDSLPKTINITATTDKGEKLTAQLPIQMVADQSAIHHLAAKALINDYETGQSWLHSLNPDLKSSNPTGFEEVLKHEAEHLGQTWSIPSRWTSYVAIDRTTAQHHAILVHKAEAIELSQLTRPRYTSPYTPIEVFKSGQSRPAPLLRAPSGPVAQRGFSGSGRSTGYAACRPPPRLALSAPPRNNSSSCDNQTADMSPSVVYTNSFDYLEAKLPSMRDSSLTSFDHNFAPPAEPSGPGAGTPITEDLHATQDEGDPNLRAPSHEFAPSPEPFGPGAGIWAAMEARRRQAQDEREPTIRCSPYELCGTKSPSLSTHETVRNNEAWSEDKAKVFPLNLDSNANGSWRAILEQRKANFGSNRANDTAESGRDSRAATSQAAYTIPGEDGELASGVQFSQGDVHVDLQGRLRPSSDLDESHSNSPGSSEVQDRPSSPSGDRDCSTEAGLNVSRNSIGPLRRSATEDQGSRRKIGRILSAVSNWMRIAPHDRYQKSDFKSGPALQFPEIPGEENRKGDLNKIRKQWNPDEFSGSLSRVPSFTGSISPRRNFEGSPPISRDKSQLTTNTPSNDKEVRDAEHTPPSGFPALETILRVQQADGKFNFFSRSFITALREKYDSSALEEFLNSRFNPKSQATSSRLTELSDNILMVVYITDVHDASKALWELQVAKAQQWIKRTIMELLKESGDAEDMPEISLEELVESILDEMEKLVLQQT